MVAHNWRLAIAGDDHGWGHLFKAAQIGPTGGNQVSDVQGISTIEGAQFGQEQIPDIIRLSEFLGLGEVNCHRFQFFFDNA